MVASLFVLGLVDDPVRTFAYNADDFVLIHLNFQSIRI